MAYRPLFSEHYNRRMDEAFASVQRIRKVVDGVVAFDQEEQEHVKHIREILHLCKEKGISLNCEKFKFCLKEVEFAGFLLSSKGYSIINDIIAAIANFPTPSSHSDLHSFMGLTNQLAACN